MKGSGIAAIVTVLAVIATGGTAVGASPADGHPVMRALDYAESEWPEEFAGKWLDLDYWGEDHVFDGTEDSFAPDRKVFFAFTDGAEQKVAVLRSMFPAPNPYIAVDHEYSYSYLRGVQQQFGVDAELFKQGRLEVPGGKLDWYGSGVNVVENFVDVSMPDSMLTTEFLTWASDRYGPAARFGVGQPIYPLGGDGAGNGLPDGRAGASGRGKKNRRLVRKCNRARKSSSAKKQRFSKSKKCRRARAKLA